MWRLGWGSAVSVRDHGGNLEQARATYGGVDWIDLSTGINRVPYPVPALSAEAFSALPTDCYSSSRRRKSHAMMMLKP